MHSDPKPGFSSSITLPAPSQVPVPPGLAGRPYGECVAHLMLSQRLLALGLYRRKSENPGGQAVHVPAIAWRSVASCCLPSPLCCTFLNAHVFCALELDAVNMLANSAHHPPALPAGTRLSYVVCNPQWHETLEATDRVFVLRPRESTGWQATRG